MIRVIRTQKQAMLIGSARLFEGCDRLPTHVKYWGSWPIIRIVFQFSREAVSKKVTWRKGSKQFVASLPALSLGLPPRIEQQVYRKLEPYVYEADFTAADDLSPEAIIVQAMDHLLQFSTLAETYMERTGTPLAEEIGVRIVWDKDPLPAAITRAEEIARALYAKSGVGVHCISMPQMMAMMQWDKGGVQYRWIREAIPSTEMVVNLGRQSDGGELRVVLSRAPKGMQERIRYVVTLTPANGIG